MQLLKDWFMIPATLKEWCDSLLGLLCFFLLMYVFVGMVSVAQIAAGADLPYMTFWHWWLKFIF